MLYLIPTYCEPNVFSTQAAANPSLFEISCQQDSNWSGSNPCCEGELKNLDIDLLSSAAESMSEEFFLPTIMKAPCNLRRILDLPATLEISESLNAFDEDKRTISW